VTAPYSRSRLRAILWEWGREVEGVLRRSALYQRALSPKGKESEPLGALGSIFVVRKSLKNEFQLNTFSPILTSKLPNKKAMMLPTLWPTSTD